MTCPKTSAWRHRSGNRIAEYLYGGVTETSALIREYVWLGLTPVAVIENDQVYFIRTASIGGRSLRPMTWAWTRESSPGAAGQCPTRPRQTAGLPPAKRAGASHPPRGPGPALRETLDYDPTTGRYLQADPLGLVDGASVYGYAGQNPGRYVDPFGLLTIFVGGAGDQVFGNAVRNYYEGYTRDENKKYFTWNQELAVIAAIQAEAAKVCPEKIIVIGHSFGADTAAKAARRTKQVDILITIDGVPQFFRSSPHPAGIAKETWINVYATGNDGTTSGDYWANKRGSRAKREARFKNADIQRRYDDMHHENFGQMMGRIQGEY